MLIVLAFVGFTGVVDVQAQEQLDFSALFAHSVPLSASSAGSFSVSGTLGGVEMEFLLDTGASMVTVSSALFKQIQDGGGMAVKVRRVGARLASGKVEVLDVYQVEHFSLGSGCDLGPVEVAVLKQGGRNLLGMNALQQAAPFAISTSPPVLGLSQCGYTAQQISLRD
jgi:predicted aspartyl protease